MSNKWKIIIGILILLAAGGFSMTAWALPAMYENRARPYLKAFKDTELKYGLPNGLLSRVAYQESRYNKSALSPAGAMGLMQFMPATAAEFGIDPADPFQSIDAAGRYLKQLYGMFGDWRIAIAAYNFGPGNVRKNINKYGSFNIAALPAETINYLSIANDIGIS